MLKPYGYLLWMGALFYHFALHTNFKTIVWCHIEAAFTTWQGLYWLSLSLTSSKNLFRLQFVMNSYTFCHLTFCSRQSEKGQLNFKAKTKIAYILETKRRRAKIAIICDHFNPCWQSNKYIEAARGHIETMFSKKSANGKCQQTNVESTSRKFLKAGCQQNLLLKSRKSTVESDGQFRRL